MFVLYYQGGDILRKTFTTTIEEKIQNDFRETCSKKNVKMNDVLEAFMKSFISGEFEVEFEYKLKSVKNTK
jgi:regulator of PEP synthase PpsR (kinase-PPPase family)